MNQNAFPMLHVGNPDRDAKSRPGTPYREWSPGLYVRSASGMIGVLMRPIQPHGWSVRWSNGTIGHHGGNTCATFTIVRGVGL
jgi:hypothetical protein